MPRRVLAGYDTHLTSFGNGPRKGLLLHCSLGHTGAYAPLGAALGGAITLTGFDQPGHGRSADWTGPGDLQDQVTAMALELLSEPMDLIGHSFGGTVALRIAVEHPELVRSLTLVEPPLMAIAKAELPQAEVQIQAGMRDFNTAFDSGDPEKAAQLFTARYGDGRPWDSLSEESRAGISGRIHLIRAGSRAVNEDFHGVLAPGRLEQARMPALVVDGGKGGPLMDAICDSLARRLPNARRVRIAGGGHMVPLTRPDALATEILQLLNASPE